MIGYKGFNKGLNCRGYIYEIDKTHIWEPKEKDYYKEISLCHRGFHFCTSLKQVFSHYPFTEGNEFAIVEASGKILTGSDKCCSEELRIVKVLTKKEVQEIIIKEEAEYADKQIYCLDIIQHLQSKYNFAVGGSISLHLNGYTLPREKGDIDVDVVMPYYQKIEEDEFVDGAEEFDGKTSGNDFQQTVAITTTDGRFLKLDVRVKPEQRYEITEYRGAKYKTSDLFTILEAKMRYAKDGVTKHKEDILFLLKDKEEQSPDPYVFKFEKEEEKQLKGLQRKGRSYDEL